MYSAFHVCNPYCGFCKPPKKQAVVCANCGWTDIDGEAEGPCPQCGATLPVINPPDPIYCTYIEEMCANPCGKGKKGGEGKSKTGRCIYHTPTA